MTTVLYVHGTGVRQPAYDLAFTALAQGIRRIRPHFTVAPCYWGGEHGAVLRADGASIPVRDTTRGDVGGSEPDDALWDLLDHDPLVELRLLSGAAPPGDELPPDAPVPGRRLTAAARALGRDEALRGRLDEAGLRVDFPHAVTAVLASAAYADAVHAGAGDDVLAPALARAVLAEALLTAEERVGGRLPLDGWARDGLVAAITGALGGSTRAPGRWFGGLVARSGLSRVVERKRAVLTTATAPVTGDVLAYLAHGAGVRSFIERAIAAVDDPPVVLLAHSLGGIASVDLLASAPRPAVRMLVTVGSQAPLLYELDALPSLRFGTPLPEWLPPWVNVFDHRDLLAFVGAGVFPGRVTDRVVDNRIGFPRSHSAYFGNRRFYDVLDESLP